MKKLDRYISKNFIKSIIISLMAFISIFILSQLFKVVRFISDGKMDYLEAAQYIVALLPKILIDVAPLSVLLGALMSINRMARNLEIISLKTAGISFRRITVYPVAIAFIISLGVFWINDQIYPKTTEITKILRRGGEEKKVPVTASNVFIKAKDSNYIYYVGTIDSLAGTAKDMQITILNDKFDKIEEIITAKSAIFDKEKNSWILKDVYLNKINEKKGESLKEYQSPKFDEEPSKFIIINKDPNTLTNKQLMQEASEIKTRGGDNREVLMKLANRYAFPFASFVVVFLGLALGSRYVRGASALSIGLSVVLGYSYYVVQGSFEALGKNGILNPFVAAWVPNIIFLALGIYFMNRAEY